MAIGKIIQISAVGYENEADHVYALCDDGTLWLHYFSSTYEVWAWEPIRPPPGYNPNEEDGS